jgi:peptidoglycan/xylan/chitin deacetylase (PgdA/CDA1 family)
MSHDQLATLEAAAADRGVTTCPRSRFHETATFVAQHVAAGASTVTRRKLGSGFGILMYHRCIDRPQGVSSPSVNVTPGRLRRQLRGLLERGFRAWTLRQAIAAYNAGERIPENVFVVTFDDGYENNLRQALPVLEEVGVPATVFIATAYLDSERPYPFDNWDAAGSSRVPAESWRPLTTAQCRELGSHELIELGAHTHTHGAFAGREEAFRRDLATCLDILDERFGVTRPTFSFPFGLTTPEMIEIAKESGVICSLQTRPERVSAASDPFHWGRFTCSDLDTPATLTAKLHGWYTPLADVLRTIKRPLAALAPRATGELQALEKPCFATDGAAGGAEWKPLVAGERQAAS